MDNGGAFAGLQYLRTAARLVNSREGAKVGRAAAAGTLCFGYETEASAFFIDDQETELGVILFIHFPEGVDLFGGDDRFGDQFFQGGDVDQPAGAPRCPDFGYVNTWCLLVGRAVVSKENGVVTDAFIYHRFGGFGEWIAKGVNVGLELDPVVFWFWHMLSYRLLKRLSLGAG